MFSQDSLLGLFACQNFDKRSDIEKVHFTVLIGIRFSLKAVIFKDVNKWTDIEKVRDTVLVDIAQDNLCEDELDGVFATGVG